MRPSQKYWFLAQGRANGVQEAIDLCCDLAEHKAGPQGYDTLHRVVTILERQLDALGHAMNGPKSHCRKGSLKGL